MSDKMICWKCDGEGFTLMDAFKVKCNICEGLGEVDDPFHDEGANFDDYDPFEGEVFECEMVFFAWCDGQEMQHPTYFKAESKKQAIEIAEKEIFKLESRCNDFFYLMDEKGYVFYRNFTISEDYKRKLKEKKGE